MLARLGGTVDIFAIRELTDLEERHQIDLALPFECFFVFFVRLSFSMTYVSCGFAKVFLRLVCL